MKTTPGSRLKAARLKMGYKQQGVANEINQSVETYKGWEQDRAKPRTYSITHKLCVYLHITIDHYVYGVENTVLSPEHQALIEKYDNASPAIQQAIDAILNEISK